jgi:integrase
MNDLIQVQNVNDVNGFDTAQETIDHYTQAAYSQSTKESYRRWVTQFEAAGFTLPATPENVVAFLVTLKKVNGELYAAQSINQCVAAISKAHVVAGFIDPTDSIKVKTLVKGYRRAHGTAATRNAAPVVKDDLTVFLSKLVGKTLIDKRNKALILLGFSGAFRRSELAALELRDLEFSGQGVIVSLRKSKTNQEGKPEIKTIPARNNKLCAVTALKEWIEASNIIEGKLFRGITRHGGLRDSITTCAINTIIKAAFEGISDTTATSKVSAHSLRVGFITTCATAKVPTHLIMQVSGHKSTQMISHYSRVVDGFEGYPDI